MPCMPRILWNSFNNSENHPFKSYLLQCKQLNAFNSHSHSRCCCCCCWSHTAIIMPYEVCSSLHHYYCMCSTIQLIWMFARCVCAVHVCMCSVVVIFDMDFYKCPTTIPISKYIYDYNFSIIAYERFTLCVSVCIWLYFHLPFACPNNKRTSMAHRAKMLQLLKYSRNYIWR